MHRTRWHKQANKGVTILKVISLIQGWGVKIGWQKLQNLMLQIPDFHNYNHRITENYSRNVAGAAVPGIVAHRTFKYTTTALAMIILNNRISEHDTCLALNVLLGFHKLLTQYLCSANWYEKEWLFSLHFFFSFNSFSRPAPAFSFSLFIFPFFSYVK